MILWVLQIRPRDVFLEPTSEFPRRSTEIFVQPVASVKCPCISASKSLSHYLQNTCKLNESSSAHYREMTSEKRQMIEKLCSLLFGCGRYYTCSLMQLMSPQMQELIKGKGSDPPRLVLYGILHPAIYLYPSAN